MKEAEAWSFCRLHKATRVVKLCWRRVVSPSVGNDPHQVPSRSVPGHTSLEAFSCLLDTRQPALVARVGIDLFLLRGRYGLAASQFGNATADSAKQVGRYETDAWLWGQLSGGHPQSLPTACRLGAALGRWREGDVRCSFKRKGIHRNHQQQTGVVRVSADDEPGQGKLLGGEAVEVAGYWESGGRGATRA
jgi:hypothetical protein